MHLALILSVLSLCLLNSGDSMAEAHNYPERPTIVAEAPDIDDRNVPIYLLTRLTDDEQSAYSAAVTTQTDLNRELEWVKPDLILWQEDREGDLTDMHRIWRETGGNDGSYHFAFFADRQCVQDKTILLAQPCHYTMLYSDSASEWARANYSSYLNRKQYPNGIEPWEVPQGSYEGWLEEMADDIVGQRGLTYGRMRAEGFRDSWCNLDIANMNMSELVELFGGTVEMVENGRFDLDACMAQLDKKIRQHMQDEGASE